jgi:hypothetical protein
MAKRSSGYETVDMDNLGAGDGARHEARVVLRGVSPYSPSRAFQTEKPKKQDHDEFDERHWRERAHVDAKDRVAIPCQAFYLALLAAAMQNGEKIPGRGNKTYTESFTSGVFVEPDNDDDGDMLTITAQNGKPVPLPEVRMEKLYLPSDGEPAFRARGASKRVWRRFPYVPAGWSVSLKFTVLSPNITKEVFFRHLRDSGLFVGVGRFRPANRGRYGRFFVEAAQWGEKVA